MVTNLRGEFDAVHWLANGRGGQRPAPLPDTYSSHGWRVFARASIPLAKEAPW